MRFKHGTDPAEPHSPEACLDVPGGAHYIPPRLATAAGRA